MVKRVQNLSPLKKMPRGILKVSSTLPNSNSNSTTRSLRRRSSPRKKRRVTFDSEEHVFSGAPTKQPIFFSSASMLASRRRGSKPTTPSPSPSSSHFNLLELLSGFFIFPRGPLLPTLSVADPLPGGKKAKRTIQVSASASNSSSSSAVSSPSPSPPVVQTQATRYHSHHYPLSLSGFRSVLVSAVLLANATSCTCCCEMP